jgi:hypothetical protein
LGFLGKARYDALIVSDDGFIARLNRNLEPERRTLNPEPGTLNPERRTPNPEPR